MDERWAVNASPLIALGRIGLLGLLSSLAAGIVVPEAVATEVKRVADEAGAFLHGKSFSVERVDPHPLVVSWGLGAGETAVLSLAKRHRNYVAVLDDLTARRCASALRIPTRGALGVILLAKSRGISPSARSVMRELQSVGLYLSPELVADALALTGESGNEG